MLIKLQAHDIILVQNLVSIFIVAKRRKLMNVQGIAQGWRLLC